MESPGQIFLSEQRGVISTKEYCRSCTFNFDSFLEADGQAFGLLYVLNDEILGSGATLKMAVYDDFWVVLIPVTGELNYAESEGSTNNGIQPEQLRIGYMPAGSSFNVTNPYESDEINFLQLWIKAEGVRKPVGIVLDFDLVETSGHLFNPDVEALGCPFKITLAKMDGRQEIVYDVSGKGASVFAFVLGGAFEVEGRLLHPRDGLGLWNITEIEAEALSEGAVLLILELL
ncbi:MAG: hypothetical protein V4721_00190 [Bacteroidota bacterium]